MSNHTSQLSLSMGNMFSLFTFLAEKIAVITGTEESTFPLTCLVSQVCIRSLSLNLIEFHQLFHVHKMYFIIKAVI
jgi:hypothetical protein